MPFRKRQIGLLAAGLCEGEFLLKNQSILRVKRSHVIHLNGQSDKVFSLFDPMGEKKWSENWNPTIIFLDSDAIEGSVFTTKDHEGIETIWVITKLDKDSQNIIYTSVTPLFKVSTIDISCEPDDINCTKAHVTYTITALSEKGKQYVKTFSAKHYHKLMTNWEKAINHYLQHGSLLQHH